MTEAATVCDRGCNLLQVNVLRPYPKSTSDAAWPTHTSPGGVEAWRRAWESIESQLVEMMLLTREVRTCSNALWNAL